MWKDPIVAEIRALREQYAEQFSHDLDAIFEDILRRQDESNREFVSFPPRKPVQEMAKAQQKAIAKMSIPCPAERGIIPPLLPITDNLTI